MSHQKVGYLSKIRGLRSITIFKEKYERKEMKVTLDEQRRKAF